MLSQYVFGPLLFLISVFIVLIILLQRGRGGGLTGALGGAGGASAFGVKAGDIFTRITAVAVLLWIVLCAVTCFWYLPTKLNIATTPSILSSEKSESSMGGMGGLGGEGIGEAGKTGGSIDGAVPSIAPEPGKTNGAIELPPAANTPSSPLASPASSDPALPSALTPQSADILNEATPTVPKP